MTHATILCPSCQCKATAYLGKIQNTNGMIHLPAPGGLYRCKACSILFRHPFLPMPELIQQYRVTSSDLWQRKESPDFTLGVRTIINTLPSGRVLDIGCYRGDFLQMLPDRYEKFGVEPSLEARQILMKRRINLVGTTIDQIEIDKPTFDAITLFDLIEHLPRPLFSLSMARKLLLPGGLIILSTGNTDALTWRLMRLDYWYYFTEHVCFFNQKWFNWASKELNLEIVLFKKFSHFKGTPIERLKQLVQSIAYLIMKKAGWNSPLQRLMTHVCYSHDFKNLSSPPRTHLWRDHVFVVLRSGA